MAFFKIFNRSKKRINQQSEYEQDSKYVSELLEANRVISKRIHIKKTLISNPDKRQIIYIKSACKEDDAINRYMELNLESVKELFMCQGRKLLYLPEFKTLIKDIITYQKPDATAVEIEKLSKELENQEFDILNFIDNVNDFPEGLRSAFVRYIGLESDEEKDFYTFSYFIVDPLEFTEPSKYSICFREYLSKLRSPGIYYSLKKPDQDDIADYFFEDQAIALMDEIRAKVALLRSYGVGEMMLRELIEPSTKISPLVITPDFDIFLPEYNNMEIKLEPLNKAVFILFLRHEEGILFKQLIDYRNELEEIYSKITKMKCNDKQRKSIAAICDPTNNSINEKCARIREAFVSQFDERLAQNYFVTGKRSEVKRITLPRELLQWNTF